MIHHAFADSPSKASSSAHSDLQALSSRRPNAATPSDASRRIFSRSRTHRLSFADDHQNGNATFLTECSFGVSHDRLVEVITDVQPFLAHWDELTSIDLSDKKLESVARLKEFLPRLDTLNVYVYFCLDADNVLGGTKPPCLCTGTRIS